MRTYCFPLDLEDYYVGLSKFGMLKSALRWFDRDLGFVLVCYWHRDCWGNRLTIDLIVDGIAVVFIAAIKRTIGYAIAAHAQRNAWTVLTAEHARGADDAQWHCRCGRASRGACCCARCCCCRCCCLSCRSSTTGYIWMTLCGKIECVYTMMIKRMCLLTVYPCLAVATYGNWPHRSCPGSRFVHCNALRHSRTGRCDSGTGSPGTSSYSRPHRIHPGNRDSRCTEHFRLRSLRCGSGTDHWRSLYGINQREFY